MRSLGRHQLALGWGVAVGIVLMVGCERSNPAFDGIAQPGDEMDAAMGVAGGAGMMGTGSAGRGGDGGAAMGGMGGVAGGMGGVAPVDAGLVMDAPVVVPVDAMGVMADVGPDVAVLPLDWWDGDYPYRRRLEFDNPGDGNALNDFVALVVLSDVWFDYGHVEADGRDLRFVDDDHSTELTYHIEQWDPGGESLVWVRVPVIDANSTTDHIWMYYGHDHGDVQDPAGTYDSRYRGVWHLDQSQGAQVDSVAGIRCDKVGGTNAHGIPGAIGTGMAFDGVNDGCHSSSDTFLGLSSHTVTAWVFLPAGGGGPLEQTIFSLESTLGNPWEGPNLYLHRPSRRLGFWIGNGFVWSPAGTNELTRDQWHFVAMRVEIDRLDGLVEMKVDDGEWERAFTGDTRLLEVIPGSSAHIGIWDTPLLAPWLGGMDEIQVHDVRRSDSWVRAQYRNEANAGFVVPQAEEAVLP